MRAWAVLTAISFGGCAAAPAPREVPRDCPPPTTVYAKDCVRKADVLNVAEQILRENEAHASQLSQLEKVLAALQEDVARALEASLQAVPKDEASVAVVGGRVRVRLSEELLFPSASTKMGESGLRALARVAEVLQKTPTRRIEVAGHTDDRPVVKGWDDNWQLSTERARQVALFLMSHGLDGRRLFVAGYADTDPVDPSPSDAARARNRRVELFIEPTAGAAADEGPDAPRAR